MSIKLRTFFALSFALIIFITTALLSISISKKSSEKLENEVGNSLAGVAFQMTDKLDYFMWSRFQEVQVFSQLQALKNNDNKEDVQSLLDHLHTNIPSFSWIGVSDKNGKVTAATDDILVGGDISQRPAFINANKEPFIGDVHDAVLLAKLIPTKNGEPLQLVDISTPIFSNDGKFKGVLAAHMSWEWSREIQNIVLQPLQGKRDKVELFIISSTDNTVLLGPKQLLGKPLELRGINVAQSKKNEWKLVKWPDGKSYLTGFAFGNGYKDYKGLGWTVIVRQPEKVAFSSVKNLQNFIFIFGTLFSIIMAIIGWFLAGMIAKPLHKISYFANELRRGKNVEIPYMKGIKDIEVLTNSLRELVSSLVRTESDLGKMETIAMHDALTGLPNRLSLYAYLDEVLKSNDDISNKVLLYLDLDGFKNVNDTLGHHIGDSLLIEVGKRIKSCLNPEHFVARLGGDEFVVIVSTDSPTPIHEANDMAKQMINVLNRSFIINGLKAQIGCSVGGAFLSHEDSKPDTILQQADQALYSSKHAGKNRVSFYKNNNKVS